jgi:hypothetical protein
MPSININFGQSGPVVNAIVTIGARQRKSLMAAGIPVPAAVAAKFLIDTGANMSCIDIGLITKFGLQPTASANVHTPGLGGNTVFRYQYEVSLYIPLNASAGCNLQDIDMLEVSIGDQGLDGLIGRDLIDQWTCIYNGSTSTFTICY